MPIERVPITIVEPRLERVGRPVRDELYAPRNAAIHQWRNAVAAHDRTGPSTPGAQPPRPVAVITVRGEDGRQMPRRVLSKDGDFDVQIVGAPRLSRVGRTLHYAYAVIGDDAGYVLDLNLDTWDWTIADAPAALRATAS